MNVTRMVMAAGTAAGLMVALVHPVHAAAGPKGHTHVSFNAGTPGDPKKPFRVIEMFAKETDKGMAYEPAKIVDSHRGSDEQGGSIGGVQRGRRQIRGMLDDSRDGGEPQDDVGYSDDGGDFADDGDFDLGGSEE